MLTFVCGFYGAASLSDLQHMNLLDAKRSRADFGANGATGGDRRSSFGVKKRNVA